MLCGTLQGRLLAPLLLILYVAFVSAEGSSEEPVVRVAQGRLRGHRIQREEGATIPVLYAFQGIPYARPPTGSRRFKDPEEPQPWTGVRNATTYGSTCVGIGTEAESVIGNEDCLFLNIFTADPPTKWKTVKRPVIVYFHGGSFIFGSGNMIMTRPDPLLRRDVLFVSINYRLGVFGLLNTKDSQAPGNAALKDQTMSLRWVQRNIAVFGGDPTQVTIMGDSSAASMVHYHIISPLSRGLFHRAISMSGSVIPNWALVDNPRESAQNLRNRWSSACPQDTEENIVSCLRNVDAYQLFSSQFEVPENGSQLFGANPFRPSVEAAGSSNSPFLTANPGQLLTEGRFQKLPYMTGFVTAEGITYLGAANLLTNASRWTFADENFEDIFPWLMPLGVARTRESARQLRSFYLGNRTLADGDENMDILNRFTQLCTDTFFAEGTVQSAYLMSEKRSKVFVYQFSHEGPAGFWKRFLNATRIPGVSHGDDLFYVFDRAQDGRLPEFPESEQRIRDRQATIFANFAKTGNPTPPGSGLQQWPAYTPQSEKYMDMGDELRVLEHPLGERMAFWRRLMASSMGSTPRPPGYNA